MGLGMSKKEIDESLLKNNIEKSSQYSNIEELRKLIDQWKNGL
jgi:hypothetical protein